MNWLKLQCRVIGMSETKLDDTICDSDIAMDGCNIVQSDRNRKGGGAVCYNRDNICFNMKTSLSNNIENLSIDLMFLETKAITIGVLYKPPNRTRFLEQIVTKFEALDLKDEHYILGVFKINLLFKRN